MSDTTQIFHTEVESQASLHKSSPWVFAVLLKDTSECCESGCKNRLPAHKPAVLSSCMLLVEVEKFTSAVTKSFLGGILRCMFIVPYWPLRVPLQVSFIVHCLPQLSVRSHRQKSNGPLVGWKQQMIVSASPTFRTTVTHLNTAWLDNTGTSAATVNHTLYIICVTYRVSAFSICEPEEHWEQRTSLGQFDKRADWPLDKPCPL